MFRFVLCLLFLLFLMPLAFGSVASSTKIIPLPIYSTLPNEGNTFGLMPVFLTVEEKDQRTQSIIAPSVSWNRLIHFTTTFRLYYYPSDIDVINFIPSVSTHINRNLTLEHFRLPREAGKFTTESALHFRRSLFYRFFGIGPQTRSGAESSYTNLGGDLGTRLGYNLSEQWNIGAKLLFERHLVEAQNVDFLPLTNAVFPNTPGLLGATTLGEFLSVRYDTRPIREYSNLGVYSEIQAGVLQGISGTDTLGKFQFETKGMWPETSFINGAARFFWGYTAGHQIPFYHQSSLGGSYRLRGFTEDRFIDKGAWLLELEQRIAYLQTKIYGVIADWRIDPFVNIGQVYSDSKDLFQNGNLKLAAGLGFRAFVRPNVLGRVDVAEGGEGLKVYVELGYPF